MIECSHFYDLLIQNDIDFFCGVPDSLLSDFCAYLYQHTDSDKNIITANEGNAVALAAGHYLATGKIGLVYMQNSGQGNAVNVLTSLVDKAVYSIPVLLLIGWRGEPGIKDEPQHVKQGRITCELLETLNIPFEIVPSDDDKLAAVMEKAVQVMKNENMPYALVVQKGTFSKYKIDNKKTHSLELTREDAIKIIVNELASDDIVVSTTGKTSRELYEYRETLGHKHDKDFLTVGSMGHASQIALGIALSKKNRKIYCLDGDGALIMHMGSLAIIGDIKPENYIHIVLNNGAHDSVGGQPTVGLSIDIPVIAQACGYAYAVDIKSEKELKATLVKLKNLKGPLLLNIQVRKGARNDLGRPVTTPIENKNEFMQFLKD